MEAEGDKKNAFAYYTAAVKAEPKNPGAWYALGMFYYSVRQKDYAVNCFDKVLALRSNPELESWLAEYKGG